MKRFGDFTVKSRTLVVRGFLVLHSPRTYVYTGWGLHYTLQRGGLQRKAVLSCTRLYRTPRARPWLRSKLKKSFWSVCIKGRAEHGRVKSASLRDYGGRFLLRLDYGAHDFGFVSFVGGYHTTSTTINEPYKVKVHLPTHK